MPLDDNKTGKNKIEFMIYSSSGIRNMFITKQVSTYKESVLVVWHKQCTNCMSKGGQDKDIFSI